MLLWLSVYALLALVTPRIFYDSLQKAVSLGSDQFDDVREIVTKIEDPNEAASWPGVLFWVVVLSPLVFVPAVLFTFTVRREAKREARNA